MPRMVDADKLHYKTVWITSVDKEGVSHTSPDTVVFAREIDKKSIKTVDETELIRALQYDREQYEKGYADGYLDCLREIDAGDVQKLLEEGYHIVNDIPMKPLDQPERAKK